MGARAARRGVVVAVALLAAACGERDHRGDAADVFADASAPAAALPACGDGVPGWRAVRCRVDRALPEGCVRATAEGAWVWPACRGAPIAFALDHNPQRAKHGAAIALVALPATLSTPAWRRAIARALVGDARVRCEVAGADCPVVDGAAAWFVAALAPPIDDDLDGMFAVPPRASATRPSAPPLAAVVLAEHAPRARALDSWLGVDASTAALAIVDGPADDRALPLPPLATCAEYELVGDATAIAAHDRRRDTWTWVAVAAARDAFGRPRCGDGVVYVPRAAAELELAIRPDTGVFAELDVATRKALAPAELAGVLASHPAYPPCGDGAVLAMTAPCRAEVGTIAIRPRATADGRVLAWRVGDRVIDRRAVFATIPDHDALARRLTGAAPIDASDPLVHWIVERERAGAHDEAGTVAPRWSAGEGPVPPPLAVARLARDPIAHADTPVGLVIALARAGATTRRATCGALEVWASPRAGAVVDRTTKRWTWLFVDVAGDTPIAAARCVGDLAIFDGDGLGVVADPRTGRWAVIGAARLAELAREVDPTTALHDELRGDE